MNALDELKTHLTTGYISLPDLCLLLPQCEGYDRDQYDKLLGKFALSKGSITLQFEVIGNKVKVKHIDNAKCILIIYFSEQQYGLIDNIELA